MAVIELFFATGARVYEISNIRAENVNLNTGLIQLMGKGAKERYIQIGSASVLDILRKYYAENRAAIKKSGYFFVNGRGNRYTEQSIRLMLKKYTAQAGIERNITPHMFRHSFATYQYFAFVACEEPDKEKIEEYITELHKKYKQKTVKRKIASVKAYYSYLEENELIKESPFRKIKVKFKETLILPRIIPREEIEHLLNHMYGCL